VPSSRLGLFGGTFDPPHTGHLLVAQDVIEALKLDRLLFVPAGMPPHKEGQELTPAPLRLEMVRGAIQGDDRLEVSEVELGRDGPSYTVDTLRYYRELHPEAELFFVMGVDQAAEFEDWESPETVAELATLVAMNREGADPAEVANTVLPSGKAVEFVGVPVTRIDLSSTDIRERVTEGRSIRYLVPEAVRRVIESHRLYRSVS
jgi:nicotinate-nucleotide adenylyltransferase